MRKTALCSAILLAMAASSPARAQMHHYIVGAPVQEKTAPAPDAAGDDSPGGHYGGGSFVVTPVQSCFDKLKPGEADALRRDTANPYEECQARLKKRAEDKAKADEKAAKDKKSSAPANHDIIKKDNDKTSGESHAE